MKTNHFFKTLGLSATLFLIMLLGISCSHIIPPDDIAKPTPTFRSQCQPIQDGITYLKAQYDPDIGLLREAPNAAPHKYWLTNDNALAAFVLAQVGENDLSNTITDSIQRYGKPQNGLIEILWSKKVEYPPHNSRLVLVKQIGEDEIWQEDHTQGTYFEDWREYTNLALLGAVNDERKGNHPLALNVYKHALDQFDGVGFRDKAYIDTYETYKLALALYVGSELGELPPDSDKMLNTLMGLQNTDGGFFTHYIDQDTPAGDTNTETTTLALLALNAVGCEQ